MTDCKGAFAFGYEFDIGGAQAAFAQYAGGKTKKRSKPSAGMTGIKVGGTNIQIVGYGCGNDTVPVAVTETKRLMEQLGADVMIGPLSGDEAVYDRELCEGPPDEDVHHRHRRLAGSDDADRSEEHVPLPRRRRPVERRHRRDRLQEARWRKPRSSWTTTASAGRRPQGCIADFCAVGGNITSACSRR